MLCTASLGFHFTQLSTAALKCTMSLSLSGPRCIQATVAGYTLTLGDASANAMYTKA